MKINKNLYKAILYCYRELYANATPSVSFDELLKNSIINKDGKREIPYMDYEIEEEILNKIINDAMNIHKIKHKILKHSFRSSILSGCSPKFKIKCTEL